RTMGKQRKLPKMPPDDHTNRYEPLRMAQERIGYHTAKAREEQSSMEQYPNQADHQRVYGLESYGILIPHYAHLDSRRTTTFHFPARRCLPGTKDGVLAAHEWNVTRRSASARR